MSQQYQPHQTHVPPTQMAYSPQSAEADRAAHLSLVFGILGLFLLGIVFGPLAISQAAKAERLNKPAVAGKVLGWISLIFGILQLLGFILWFFAAAAVLTTM